MAKRVKYWRIRFVVKDKPLLKSDEEFMTRREIKREIAKAIDGVSARISLATTPTAVEVDHAS